MSKDKTIDRAASKQALKDYGLIMSGFSRAHGLNVDTLKKYFTEPSPIMPGSDMTLKIEAALKKCGLARYTDAPRGTIQIKRRTYSVCTQQGNVKKKAA